MRGNRPLAFGGVLGSCLVGFCLVLGLLVFSSPSSCCVSFPFNDDLGTPPTRRPHSWKKKCLPQLWAILIVNEPPSFSAQSLNPESSRDLPIHCLNEGSGIAGIHFVSIVSRSRSGTPTGGCWGCCGCCCWFPRLTTSIKVCPNCSCCCIKPAKTGSTP